MLTIDLRCTRCSAEFPVAMDVYRALDFNKLPKRCPKCSDELQERPDVVLERTTLYEQTVRIHPSFSRLFERATKFQPLPTDKESWRLTLKGNQYGVQWHGRIDIFSHAFPIATDDVLVLSYNAVRRRVWYVEYQRYVGSMTTHVRRVTCSKRVPHGYVPQEGESAVREREETNEYVLLTRTVDSTAAFLQRDALPKLVWVEAYSKTTLKGHGRQFHRQIVGTPIFSLGISGSCRSGRYGTNAMLAVVDPLDPLKVVGGGDVDETEVVFR